MTTTLLFKKLDINAKIPERGSKEAIGYDLFCSKQLTIDPNDKGIVNTSISMEVVNIPDGENWYARIAPRSGLAAKKHLDIGAGVVDSDYRGELKVVVFNHASTKHTFNVGDKVAQLIIERAYIFPVKEVVDLTETERGENGFGSTGV